MVDIELLREEMTGDGIVICRALEKEITDLKEQNKNLLTNTPSETPDNTKLLELIEKYGESKWVAGLSGSSKPIELLDKIKGLLK